MVLLSTPDGDAGKQVSRALTELYRRPVSAHGHQLDQCGGVPVAVQPACGSDHAILDVISEEFRLLDITMQDDVVPALGMANVVEAL